jgi:uncharacterized protein (DUF1697 family)
MADLRALVEELGGEEVRTYLQSGNVVFRSRSTPSKLEEALAQSIRRTFGLDVTVLVLTAERLAKIVADNPFVVRGAAPAALHVTFLASRPDPTRVRRLSDGSFAPDEFRAAGDAVYLHCPNGYGRTKLSNAVLEKQLAVPATTRNWKTVMMLAELVRNG